MAENSFFIQLKNKVDIDTWQNNNQQLQVYQTIITDDFKAVFVKTELNIDEISTFDDILYVEPVKKLKHY